MGMLRAVWMVVSYVPPVWVLVLNQVLFMQAGVVSEASIPTKSIVVEIQLEEPFDMCARTSGEDDPRQMYGHAFDSKPYGCL